LDTSNEVQRIEEDHRKALKEKELSLGNEIHRLRAERDECEESVVSLTKEVKLTKDMLQRMEEDVRNVTAEGKKLREAKLEAEEESKKLQQTASRGLSLASELANVSQQLAQKITEAQLKESELVDLRKDHTELEGKLAMFGKEKDRLELELAQSLTTVGALRRDLDVQAKKQEETVATTQELRKQLESLDKEKKALDLSTESSRATESKFNDAQAKFSADREHFRNEMTMLRAVLAAKERELQLMRSNTIEKIKKIEEDHSNDVDELRRRLHIAETAVEVADAKTRRIEDEKSRELEAHKQIVDEKVERLVREKVAANEQERQRQAPQANVSQQSLTGSSMPLDEISNTGAGRPRKRVERLNNSVLSVVGQPRAYLAYTSDGPDLSQGHNDGPEVVSYGNDIEDSHETEDLGARERLDENGVFVVDPTTATAIVAHTGLTQPFKDFNIGLAKESRTAKDCTSSSLSDISSSDLIDMGEVEDTTTPVGVSRVQESFLPEELPSRIRVVETPFRTTNHPSQDQRVHWSQNRPKSQANTALRMTTPGPSTEQSANFRREASRSVSRQPKTSKHGGTKGISDRSSPAYVHRPPSSNKTYGHHIGAPSTIHTHHHRETSDSKSRGSKSKRKSTASRGDGRISSKRFRSSSQSLPNGIELRTSQRSAPDTSSLRTRRRDYDSSQSATRLSQTYRAPVPGYGQTGSPRRTSISSNITKGVFPS
jgi:hypothetical protein